MADMSESEKMEILGKLEADLPLFCSLVLQVKAKSGQLVPFHLNKAQQRVHREIEEMKQEYGKARILVVKARQLGISTYLSARNLHNILFRNGTNAMIVAHDSDSSQNIFRMLKRFLESPQVDGVLPLPETSNRAELIFSRLNTQVRVGTAGSKALGRSQTNTCLHFSEVAFVDHAHEHAKGLLQTIPNEDDTEVIMESTANGMGDYWHQAVMASLNEESDYRMIFIPFYEEDGYQTAVPEGFALDTTRPVPDMPSEQEYLDAHQGYGLTIEHLVWRRFKIQTDFGGDAEGFRQEYPFTAHEAFQASTMDSYINPVLIDRAWADKTPRNKNLPIVFGVDPARMGRDRFTIHIRSGRWSLDHVVLPQTDLVVATDKLVQMIQEWQPAMVNIDVGGLGVGVYDMLCNRGYANRVSSVNFGGTASDPDRFENKVSEMFAHFKEWLEDEPCSMALLNNDVLTRIKSQASQRHWEWKHNGKGMIEPKSKYKDRLNSSPDDLDATLLTFATRINPESMFAGTGAINNSKGRIGSFLFGRG